MDLCGTFGVGPRALLNSSRLSVKRHRTVPGEKGNPGKESGYEIHMKPLKNAH